MTQAPTQPKDTDTASSNPGSLPDLLAPSDHFAPRHLGPSDTDIVDMLGTLGYSSLDELIDATLPESIRFRGKLRLPDPLTEQAALAEIKQIASRNRVCKSYIGQGYHGTITPPVILRNILENPGWYTQYTPYQPEISQGRLEALVNYQTMVSDLTGMEVANGSLLDEPTAAAEAMAMCFAVARQKKQTFLVLDDCHPQTINVCRTRADSMGITLKVVGIDEVDFAGDDVCGVLAQYPSTDGCITTPKRMQKLADAAHESKAMFVVAADILALTLLTPPGEFGADIVVGSTQRFGVPMGFGGPHAAYMATHEKHVRKMPGRLVGVSKDAEGNPAYRLAIQTREQHIKRERATSNICTAQVLLAIMASMYAVWHGPDGLRRIARRVHGMAKLLKATLADAGVSVEDHFAFDVVSVPVGKTEAKRIVERAAAQGINLRIVHDDVVNINVDETTTVEDIDQLIALFTNERNDVGELTDQVDAVIPADFARESDFLTHPVFHRYHCEHEMLRYMNRLQSKDLSLTTSMIPLGSCTMKLNATSEMIPITWPEFANLHPFAPADQWDGYRKLFDDLESWLAEMTGFKATSLQPNAGSQGEYAGLMAIRGYHHARGDTDRDVCLIPVSAHGTNPASAVIAGFDVVKVDCDPNGNIDVDDLRAKAKKHADRLAALMITYPSTHGVFEEAVEEICNIVHEHGGQVYMDGANLNAMVGLCRPADFGADVCHFNLHKTFCIPHGGGGPGMGPIACAEHLADFLPGDPLDSRDKGDGSEVGPISATMFGSAAILPISWMYIRMMGEAGLRKATQVAILNANYMANRLGEHYPVLFTGKNGRCAHEFILDCRHLRVGASVEVEDIAKRLMDYGFHAPTMSWPVAGTLMIEPTESESKEELDRLCDALIAIRAEARAIEEAKADLENNVLKHAPHTAAVIGADNWTRPYSRQQAAWPVERLKEYKYWPPVSRIDNPYGDRHLFCSCVPVEGMEAE